MFCTSCGTELSESPVLDVLITRYRCPAGHLFYRGGRPPGHIPDPTRAKETAGLDDRRLLEFWLSNGHARVELPDDLASVCRRLLDLETVGATRQEDFWPEPVARCFVCGSRVSSHGQDPYMSGYLCERGHQFWERGGHMNLDPPDHEKVTLSIEPDPWWAARLADSWLGADANHSQVTTPYISPALRHAIRRMRPKLGSPNAPPPAEHSE